MAEWLHYSEAAIFTHLLQCAQVEEPFSVAPPPSAAPTKEGPSSSVALATTNLAASSIASSQDVPTEESMELDYADNFLVPTNPHPETTPQVVPSPLDMAIVNNIATPAIPEAGPSGSIDTANAVLEHWVDIMSNEAAAALRMDEQVG
ncbi:hypothetical protein C0989_011127 [Termitomyces sp. Mn162]|nr:hypothetical protein C0989_011127 [Termitomyces sp. Mn162]